MQSELNRPEVSSLIEKNEQPEGKESPTLVVTAQVSGTASGHELWVLKRRRGKTGIQKERFATLVR